jgi:hypothetical protein
LTHELESAWFQVISYQVIDILVSKFAFQIQPAPPQPGDFPTHGLAPEVHRWLRQKIPGAISGHIQPGCTLLTVDFMLSLEGASQIRTDGVQALADALLAGPLGARGDVTVGMGPEALVCVADRDAATGNVIPGRFSRRVPLNAAGLMPGGAEAARACAASLRANSQSQHPGSQFLRISPSCVFSGSGGGRSEREFPETRYTGEVGGTGGNESIGGNGDSEAARMSTVCVTFPAAALPGCAMRCRAHGRTVPISIVSVFRGAFSSSPSLHDTSTEAMTLVVNIEAAGVDGVAMLELVRSSHGVADVLGNHNSAQHADLSGVPAGLPAMSVLLVSDREVYDSLAEILELTETEQSSSFGQHSSTLYALGATMRGKASPQHAFQSACWAASKGKMGRALTLRLLQLYPATSIITTAADAGTLLLHAAASGDLRTVLTALYHCQAAVEFCGFDASELASLPVGAGGETPLHRAAAVHGRGGDADVLCELLATMETPLAWSMRAAPEGLKLVGSMLLHEAVAAATATLVRVARRYPRSASEAGTPSADEIIQEAKLVSPLPAGATPRENASAAITLELLSSPGSAARLLSVAARFNANNTNTAGGSLSGGNDEAVVGGSNPGGDGFSAVGGSNPGGDSCGGDSGDFSAPTPGHDASPLAPSSLFPTETNAGTFVAQALQRWPTLGCGRTPSEKTADFFHRVIREGAVKSVRRFRKVKSWLVSHRPNGDGSLMFNTDPKLERTWMDSRAKMQQWALDYPAYLFLVAFNVVALYRFHIKPLLARWTDRDSAVAADFDWFMLIPLAYFVLFLGIMKTYPEWYSRHRETVIMANRFFTQFFPLEKINNVRDVSPFLRQGSTYKPFYLSSETVLPIE